MKKKIITRKEQDEKTMNESNKKMVRKGQETRKVDE